MSAKHLGSPLIKYSNVVLSNGASLRIPMVQGSKDTIYAVNDIFNNAQWNHKLKTESSLQSEKNILPDMSEFYSKFGSKAKKASRGEQ
mmetsp:Transcript_12774/g.34833  ORF Transcript_12774/g.34833 Transcript_12774/m.34833 type:complete len:88 (+) Transcript_12774:29-292(+)